jgi:hypothetical protein
MPEQRLSWLRRVHHGFREWRRLAKSLLPFVRRRVYRRLEQRHDELAAVFLGGMSPAASAAVRLVKDLDDSSQAEVCLFVSHAPQPVLKAHVVAHITQLCDAGVQVVLIVNTDLPLADIVIEPVLLARLGACVVRENLGLDFAAWAHGQQLFSARMRPRRLMLHVAPTSSASPRTSTRATTSKASSWSSTSARSSRCCRSSAAW